MIEVENSYFVGPEQLNQIIDGANYKSENVNADIYYDYSDFRLFLNQTYLRNRNGAFELKWPVRKKQVQGDMVIYDEIEEKSAIFSKLRLNEEFSFEQALIEAGLSVIANYKVTRKTYQKDGFTIAHDKCSFGFEVVEIELIVESEDEVEDAEARIIEYSKRYGIGQNFAGGKMEAYIKINNPEIYAEYLKQF